jgi:cell division protein FtsL
MKKRYIKITGVILVLIFIVVYVKYTSLKFDIDITDVYSIEYSFENYNNGNFDYINGEITDKEEISKIINYFNSISLLRTPEKPKDATQWLSFKDKEGNEIEGYAFGASVLWDWNKTYMFGDYYQNRIKKLLSIEEIAK